MSETPLRTRFYTDVDNFLHVETKNVLDGSISDYPNDGVCEKCGKEKKRPHGIIKWREPHKFLVVGEQEGVVIFKDCYVKAICLNCYGEVMKNREELWGKEI